MNPYGRTDEQQAIANAQAQVGALQKEIRILRAALNLRDVKIAALEAKLAALLMTEKKS